MIEMMQKKKLCILLTAIVLLSGMCFEKAGADSYFAYVSDQMESSVLSVFKRAPVRPEACTEELLGGQCPGGIAEQIEHSDKSTDQTAAVLLPSAKSFLQIPAFTHRGACAEAACRTQSSMSVIIGYIHHQDGAKEV